MNRYRFAALALATCAASLSVTACTAGISTVSPPASSAAASSRSASAAASAPSPSPAPASSGQTLAVSGSVGGFPVPAGAKVVENLAASQETTVIFEFVTPAEVSSFYAAALPRAGYTITTNSVISQGGNTTAIIEFAGHGFKGNMDALANYPNTGVSIAGLGHKNVTTVAFLPS